MNHRGCRAGMLPSAMAAAPTVAATTVETAAVELSNAPAAVVKSAVEVVIVESALEPVTSKAAEANATIIGPTITPVRIVLAGVVVVRYRHGTVCCW